MGSEMDKVIKGMGNEVNRVMRITDDKVLKGMGMRIMGK